MFRKCCAATSLVALVLTGCGSTGVLSTPGTVTTTPTAVAIAPSAAIKHVVVIFGENISFDHYFGTYPNAANTGGTTFTAAAGTPVPNNYISNPALLTGNPNLASGNGASASNPFRLGPNQAGTGDQGHNYAPEQAAFDGGKMDLFPASVGAADSATLVNQTAAPGIAGTTALTMGYYDGNTVTALWNYAQHYAMNDHSFGTAFGPSTPGAINLISGQTNGAIPNPALALSTAVPGSLIADGQGSYTMINDITPTNEACPDSTGTALMSGKNVGDLLNTAGLTWGWFEGGFNLKTTNANGTTSCGRTTGPVNIPGHPLKTDYIAHHEPFQYYTSTANPAHNAPTPGVAIGAADAAGANHQYDTTDFDAALAAGSLPAVSFLKAPGYQDAHAGYSDPLDEQAFVVKEINAIQSSPFWQSTAIIIAYDDSDGWYDHLNMLVNGSQVATVDGSFCNGTAPTLVGPNSNGNPVQGRCGYGPRLPLLVISPYAKKNFIDNTVTDQSSVTRFIEDIFLGSQRIGGGSTDTQAGSLMNMFNFTTTGGVAPNANVVLLNATTGAVTTGN
jgi:phospholipase C